MDELQKAVDAMQSGDDSVFQTIYSATYKYEAIRTFIKYSACKNVGMGVT